jgi:hypothetical protein
MKTSDIIPPGFDFANAMPASDVFWPDDPSGQYGSSGSTWGRMIVEDRHASISPHRQWLNDAICLQCVAHVVKQDIEHATVWGTDMDIHTSY